MKRRKSKKKTSGIVGRPITTNKASRVKDETEKRGKRDYVRRGMQKVTDAPITSDRAYEERKEKAREIAAQNKSRAKAMERRIAKVLMGDRTPMSGAGATKGDVRVMFRNRPGHYMIECKLTAQDDEVSGPTIAFNRIWLDKMHEEAKAMRSLFAVLIVHYMNYSNDFVFIRVDDYNKILPAPDITKVLDLSHKQAKNIRVSRYDLLDIADTGLLKLAIGEYYIFTLQVFRDMMEEI